MIGVSFLYGADIFVNKKSGLMWQDNSVVKEEKRVWSEKGFFSSKGAIEYCKDLELEGYDDWRLPTIKELQSIVDITKYNPAIKDGFKNVASLNYWSSSEDVSRSSRAWGVYFGYGSTYNYGKTNEYYVRCVRGRQ